MAFRSDDQDYRWPHPGGHRQHEHHGRVRGAAAETLSLNDTLRELAVTIAGFVGAILLITAAVSALNV